jgi:multidrug resistance efflux pump
MDYSFSKIKSLYFIGFALIWVSCANENNQKELTAASIDSANRVRTNDRVFGVARIEPEEGIISLVAGTNGKIKAVLIEDNMLIEKGQSLLEIDQSVEMSQLEQAQSKISTQRIAINTQKANVETTRVRLKNAEAVLNRNQELFLGYAATKQALDDSRFAKEQIEKELASAVTLIAQANSRLNELERDKQYYETLLKQKRVLSTEKGKILKVHVKAGEYAQNDKVIAEFAPDGPLVAKTEIDEIYADRIKIGQSAAILSQTSGDTLAYGTVIFAADYLKAKSLFKDQSTELEDRRIREVHIKINKGLQPLIGSRVDCIILLK